MESPSGGDPARRAGRDRPQAIDDRIDETARRQVLAAEERAKAVLLGKFADI